MKKHLKAKTVKNMALALSVAVASPSVVPVMAMETEVNSEVGENVEEVTEVNEAPEEVTGANEVSTENVGQESQDDTEVTEENVEITEETIESTETEESTESTEEVEQLQPAVEMLAMTLSDEWTVPSWVTEEINTAMGGSGCITTNGGEVKFRIIFDGEGNWHSKGNSRMKKALELIERHAESNKTYTIELTDNLSISDDVVNKIKNLNLNNNATREHKTNIKLAFVGTNGTPTITYSKDIHMPLNMDTSNEILIKNISFNFTSPYDTVKGLVANGNKITLEDCNLNGSGFGEFMGGFRTNDDYQNGNGTNKTIDFTLKNVTLGSLLLTGYETTNRTFNQINSTFEGNVTVTKYGINAMFSQNSSSHQGNTINKLNITIKEGANVQAGTPGNDNGGLLGSSHTSYISNNNRMNINEINFDVKGLLSGLGNNNIKSGAKVSGEINIDSTTNVSNNVFSGKNLSELTLVGNINENILNQISTNTSQNNTPVIKALEFSGMAEDTTIPVTSFSLSGVEVRANDSISASKAIEFVDKNTHNGNHKVEIDLTEIEEFEYLYREQIGSKISKLKFGENLKTIKDNGFLQCNIGNNILEVEIPSSIINIGSNAFERMQYKNIKFKGLNNVESIGSNAFLGSEFKVDTTENKITLNNLKTIGTKAFLGSTIKDNSNQNMTTIQLGNNTRNIGNQAFSGYTVTTSEEGISITSGFETKSFSGANLNNFVIRNNIDNTNIGYLERAFNGASGTLTVKVGTNDINTRNRIINFSNNSPNLTINIVNNDYQNPEFSVVTGTFKDNNGFNYNIINRSSKTATLLKYDNTTSNSYAESRFEVGTNEANKKKYEINNFTYKGALEDVVVNIVELGNAYTDTNIFANSSIDREFSGDTKVHLNFENVTKVNENVFKSAQFNNDKISLPSVTEIKDGAFSNINSNSELDKFTLNLTTIPTTFGEEVFKNSKLTIDLTSSSNNNTDNNPQNYTELKVVTPSEATKLVSAIISGNELNQDTPKVNIRVKDNGTNNTYNSGVNIKNAIKLANAHKYIQVNGENVTPTFDGLEVGYSFKDGNNFKYQKIDGKNEIAIVGRVANNDTSMKEETLAFATTGNLIEVNQTKFRSDESFGIDREDLTLNITQIGDGQNPFIENSSIFDMSGKTVKFTSVKKVKENAFKDFSQQNVTIALGQNIDEIGEQAFANIAEDKNFTINLISAPKTISENSFANSTLNIDFTGNTELAYAGVRNLVNYLNAATKVNIKALEGSVTFKNVQKAIRDASKLNSDIINKVTLNGNQINTNSTYEDLEVGDKFTDNNQFLYQKIGEESVALIGYDESIESDATSTINIESNEYDFSKVTYGDKEVTVTQLGNGVDAVFEKINIGNKTIKLPNVQTIKSYSLSNNNNENVTIEFSDNLNSIESFGASEISSTRFIIKLTKLPEQINIDSFNNSLISIDIDSIINEENVSQVLDFIEEVIGATQINVKLNSNKTQIINSLKQGIEQRLLLKDKVSVNSEYLLPEYAGLENGIEFKDETGYNYIKNDDGDYTASIVGYGIDSNNNFATNNFVLGNSIDFDKLTYKYNNTELRLTQIGDSETNENILKDVVIPGTILNISFSNADVINNNAFKNSSNLSNINIDISNVTTVKENAFAKDNEEANAKTVKIGKTLSILEPNALAGENLTGELYLTSEKLTQNEEGYLNPEGFNQANIEDLIIVINNRALLENNLTELNSILEKTNGIPTITSTSEQAIVKLTELTSEGNELYGKVKFNGKVSAPYYENYTEVFVDSNDILYKKPSNSSTIDNGVAIIGYNQDETKEYATSPTVLTGNRIIFDTITYNEPVSKPINITEIGNGTQSVIENSTYFELPTERIFEYPNIIKVNANAFRNMSGNKNTVLLGRNLENIGENAFGSITAENKDNKFTLKLSNIPTVFAEDSLTHSTLNLDLTLINLSNGDNLDLFNNKVIPALRNAREVNILVNTRDINSVSQKLTEAGLNNDTILVNGSLIRNATINLSYFDDNESISIEDESIGNSVEINASNLNKESLESSIRTKLSGTKYANYNITIYKDANRTQVLQDGENIEENKTYYVSLSKNQYTVTFNPNNGKFNGFSGVAETDDKGRLARPANSDPVREGYTFLGWYTNPELTRRFVFLGEGNATELKEDITLYAKWLLGSVSSNGGSSSSGSSGGGASSGGSSGSSSSSSTGNTTTNTTEEQKIETTEEVTTEVSKEEVVETVETKESEEVKELKIDTIKLPEVIEEKEVEFKDVKEEHWAKGSIERLSKAGIINGTAEGEFDPTGKTKRADVTVMLVKLLGLEGEEVTSNFTDVEEGKYYAKYVGIARDYGIVSGDNGKFRPEENISRQDTMVMVGNIIDRLGIEANKDTKVLEQFKDEGSISGYARERVAELVNLGIINGSNGNINPKSEITRAEMSVIIERLYDLISERLGK